MPDLIKNKVKEKKPELVDQHLALAKFLVTRGAV